MCVGGGCGMFVCAWWAERPSELNTNNRRSKTPLHRLRYLSHQGFLLLARHTKRKELEAELHSRPEAIATYVGAGARNPVPVDCRAMVPVTIVAVGRS